MMDGPIREALLYIADALISIGFVKGTLLVVAALLLGTLLRRASAAMRAGVWGTAILAMVAMPLLWHAVPWWELGVLRFPRSLFVADTGLQHRVADVLGSSAVREGPPVAIWLALVWLAGAIVLGAHFCWQRLGVELVARSGERARDRRTRSALARLRAALGIRRPIRVVHSDLVASPFAFGVWRPTVVLPAGARAWSEAQLESVLRHELAHIARLDYGLLLAGEIVRILYWPNPAIWLALGALRRAQDAACDDLVLRGGVPAATYARHLVAVARSTLSGSALPRAALPLMRQGELPRRVGAVLDRTSDRRPVTRFAFAAGGAAAIAIAVTIASLNLWDCATAAGASAPTAVASGAAASGGGT